MTQYITIKDLGDVLYVVTVHQDGKIKMSTFEKKNIDINIDVEKQEITIVSDKETMTFLYKNVTLPVTTALADLSTLLNSYLEAGTSVSPTLGFELLSNKSSSIATDWDSTDKYPNVKTIKEYVDASVSGLFDYRGGHDVSVGNLPSVGGSGNAGAIQKGDAWVIAGAGTIGTTDYSVGDIIIAKIDNPSDDDENDWNLLITGVSYVPEDSANKVTSVNVISTDDQYPSAKAMYAALQSKVNNANHALSISGQNLTIVGGNTVTLPSGGSLGYYETGADGTNAATASELIIGFNLVDYAPTAVSGVALPLATEGSEIYLVNRSLQPIYVYGDTSNNPVIKYSIVNFNNNSSRITVKSNEAVRFIKVNGGWFAENFKGKSDTPKVYKAFLTCTGTNNPTVTVLNGNDANYLGDLPWIYASNAGQYFAVKTGASTSNSIIHVTGMETGGGDVNYTTQSYTNGFGFRQFVAGVATDGLYKCYVTIEYYGS